MFRSLFRLSIIFYFYLFAREQFLMFSAFYNDRHKRIHLFIIKYINETRD